MITVDRIESEVVVCENSDRRVVYLDKSSLPLDVKEGDILKLCNGKYIIDDVQTKIEEDRVRKIFEELKKCK